MMAEITVQLSFLISKLLHPSADFPEVLPCNVQIMNCSTGDYMHIFYSLYVYPLCVVSSFNVPVSLSTLNSSICLLGSMWLVLGKYSPSMNWQIDSRIKSWEYGAQLIVWVTASWSSSHSLFLRLFKIVILCYCLSFTVVFNRGIILIQALIPWLQSEV